MSSWLSLLQIVILVIILSLAHHWVCSLVVTMHAQIMEPLIYDPLGQPLYKGPLYKSISHQCTYTFSTFGKRTASHKGQNGWTQSVLYSEVPQYIQDILSILIIIIIIDYYTVSEYFLLLLLTILSSGTHVIAIIINIGITSLLLLLLLLLLFMYRLLTSLKHLPRML